MVDRHESGFESFGGFSGCNEVDELAWPGHVDGVGGDDGSADRFLLLVERLDDEELDAFEAIGLDRRYDCCAR